MDFAAWQRGEKP